VELLLIRHALPEHVETRDGSPADPPLSAVGRAQAERLAEWLAGEEIAAVYASPMRRARQTAEPLARTLGLEVALEPRIVEMDHRSDVYIPLEKLKREDYPRWQELVQRGGLWAGVDLAAFRTGVVEAIEEMIAAHRSARVVVVCHGGVVNAWAGHVLGIADPFFLDARYTSVSRFLAAGTGERSLLSLNETAHLREIHP
jgi:2,3-bisphosphoglycerate-dependent phosphoglycerate mutase